MDFDKKVIPFELHPMGMIEVFSHLGAPLSSLLDGTELGPSALQMSGLKISYSQQARLIENALNCLQLPGLGLRVGLALGWQYNGSVAGIVSCSPNLADAGVAFRRYLQIAQPLYRLYFSQPDFYLDSGSYLVSPMRTLMDEAVAPELARFELEFRLALTLRFYDACGNKSVADPSVLVGLHYDEPDYVALYGDLPMTAIKFNCAQSYVAAQYDFFTTSWRPLRQSIYQRVINQCETEFADAGIETAYADKVRWLIGKSFNHEINLPQVADQLELSPRALTRKLAAEGTHFREIHNQVRMELTCLHVRSSNLPLAELADLMGFSCAASLRRAVKSWTGDPLGSLKNAGGESSQTAAQVGSSPSDC